jgi:hypothetical protein
MRLPPFVPMCHESWVSVCKSEGFESEGRGVDSLNTYRGVRRYGMFVVLSLVALAYL